MTEKEPIRTETVLFPVGEFEGTAALRVDITPQDGLGFDDVASVVMSSLRPSHQVIWFDRVPWGAPALDHIVRSLQGTQRLAEVPFLSVVPIGAESWGGADVMWIGDATALLADPVTMQGVRDRVMALPYYPDLAEVIVVEPAHANIVAACLDEVQAHLRPQGVSWLYVEPGDRDEGVKAVTGSMTPWGLRTSEVVRSWG